MSKKDFVVELLKLYQSKFFFDKLKNGFNQTVANKYKLKQLHYNLSNSTILGYSADSVFETKIGNWTKKRPVWIKMMLQSVNREDIQRSYAPYLDLYLTKLASKNYKQISSIETVEEQCKIINKLDKNLVSEA